MAPPALASSASGAPASTFAPSNQSYIKFTPLNGARNEGPLCYLLQIEEMSILLDCGWDDSYDTQSEYIQELKRIAPTIDVVLLSHADIAHVAALPYLMGKCGCKAKVFATLPVTKMGQMTMYDTYQAYANVSEVEKVLPWNLDDVDLAFDNIQQLKYSQRHLFRNGVTIAAFAAGHSLGGAVWRISKETDVIVYAVDYNHRKERHLNASVLSSVTAVDSSAAAATGDAARSTASQLFGRPSLLITDAYNAGTQSIASKESNIVESVESALRDGGNVLMPVDSAGRVFELMIALEQHWKSNRGLQLYGLAFLSNVSFQTVEFASHQIEWMSEAVVRGFDEKRENPLQFKHLKLCHTMEELQALPQPMVVMAPQNTLESGFARQLFSNIADNPSNLVLFTDRSLPNSLARQLISDHAKGGPRGTSPIPAGMMLFKMQRRIPLEGRELAEFEKKQQALKEAEKKRKREEQQRKNVIEIRDAEAGEDMMDDDAGDESEAGGMASHPRLFLPENMRYYSQHLMFPCIEKSVELSEYGVKIDVEDLRKRSLQIYQEQMMEEHAGPGAKGKKRGANDDAMKDEGEEEEEEEQVTPTKCVEEQLRLSISCRLEFVDFEGRSDGRSIRHILSQINPRKLIIVHGESSATDSLRSYCVERKVVAEEALCFAPAVRETVDIAMDTFLFKVKLREDLMNRLEYARYGTYDITFVEGEYQFDFEQQTQRTVPAIALPSSIVQEDPDNTLALEPRIFKGHDTLLIGDIKINQFREYLHRHGFRTEFGQQGTLFVNKSVSVRRDAASGQVFIEGTFCPDYFKVR